METTTADSVIPVEVLAEMQVAADLAATGIRNPEAMLQACARMDRRREEVYQKHGLLDIGVSAIRELRDGE